MTDAPGDAPDDGGDPAQGPAQDPALLHALGDVLEPLARLALGHGLTFGVAQELLKRAFVQAALTEHGERGPDRAVSRISTTTGLHRRDVTRLLQTPREHTPAPRSLATEVFAQWTTSPDCRDEHGKPLALPRQGPAPSFEALARAVTRDVHPRALLEELLRLGIASHDKEQDRVRLEREAFVPRGDTARMLGFLGDNLADHAQAAVDNVMGGGDRHFEQALFANELSAHGVQQARQAITAQWKSLVETLVPVLEQLIEDDRRHGRPRDQRLRVGLYSYDAGHAPTPARKRHD